MSAPTGKPEGAAPGKARFTPGPWRIAPGSEYQGSDINVDAGGRAYICKAGVRGDAVAEANAHLIAAAPDMRDALVKIAFEPIGPSDATHEQVLAMVVEIARAALAKASPDSEGRA